MEACTDGERQSAELRGTDPLVKVDDVAADEAEGDLRENEVEPVDPLVEDGADNAEGGVEDPGKKQRRNETGCEDGVTREHRKHGSVKETDQERGEAVDEGGGDDALEMELAQKFVACTGPGGKAAGGEEVHRVPEAMVSKDAEDAGGDSHGQAAGYASLDPRRDLEGGDGEDLAVHLVRGETLDRSS